MNLLLRLTRIPVRSSFRLVCLTKPNRTKPIHLLTIDSFLLSLFLDADHLMALSSSPSLSLSLILPSTTTPSHNNHHLGQDNSQDNKLTKLLNIRYCSLFPFLCLCETTVFFRDSRSVFCLSRAMSVSKSLTFDPSLITSSLTRATRPAF